ATASGELDGQRSAPRSGAEHGNRCVAFFSRNHGATALVNQLVAAGCCWFACCAYSASKLTGGRRNCGKPPWVTSCDTVARAYGNNTLGQTLLIARLTSG